MKLLIITPLGDYIETVIFPIQNCPPDSFGFRRALTLQTPDESILRYELRSMAYGYLISGQD